MPLNEIGTNWMEKGYFPADKINEMGDSAGNRFG